MTTAHRPTWVPKQGGEQREQQIYGVSHGTKARDIAAHTKLKFREGGQSSVDDVEERDLKSELEDRENKHFREKDRALTEQGINPPQRLTFIEEERAKALKGKHDGSVEEDEDGPRLFQPSKLDADDDGGAAEESEEEESDSDDDDEDDTHELLAELERIKKEREEEEASRKADEEAAAAKEKEEELVVGNPLLRQNAAGGFGVKRRWDDDVVFRNQAKSELKVKKRFINDTVRNDFHKRFLDRYIK